MKLTHNSHAPWEAKSTRTERWRMLPHNLPGVSSLLTGLAAALALSLTGGVFAQGSYVASRAPEAPPETRATATERAASNKAGPPETPASAVLPILKRTCVSCHGPEKSKAGLRLDSFEAIMKGGENGAVIKPGKAKSSPLIQRLLLPLKHDDHMPPADKPQPTAEEIAMLRRWVDAGALAASTTPQLNPAAAPPHQAPFLSQNQNEK